MPLGIENKGKPSLQRIDDINFFDIKRYAAKRGSDMLFGQGVNVKIKDNEEAQTFINKLLKINRFDALMQNIGTESLYWGGTILTINKTKSDDFIFSFATPELLQIVNNIEITPTSARLMLRKVIGLKVFFVIEEWTTTEVKRSLSVSEVAGKYREYDSKKDGEIPKELQLPVYEKHNLGFIPFQVITFRENRNVINAGINNWARHSIDADVAYLADSINYSLRQHYKEKWKGATRVFGQFDSSYAQKLVSNGTISQTVADDYIINADMTPNQSKPIEAVQGTYDAQKWLTGWQAEIDLYMIGCGYSPVFQQGQAGATEAQTLISKDNDQRTTKQLRRRFTEILSNLFAQLLVYKGFAKDIHNAYDIVTIQIRENVVYNQMQLVEFLNSAKQYGLMTNLEAIMLMRDIDNEADAEIILSEIEKDQEKAMQQMVEQQGQLTNASQPQGTPPLIGNMAQGGEADPVLEEE